MAQNIKKDVAEALDAGKITWPQAEEVRALRKQHKAQLRKAANAVKANTTAVAEASAIQAKIDKIMGVQAESTSTAPADPLADATPEDK